MNHAIELPQSLLKRLEKVTAGTRTTPAAIVRDAVRQRVAYEEYKRKEIEAGLSDIAAGRVHSTEDVKKMLGIKNVKKR
jgi:predicted transcriptional regulator